MDEIKVFCSHTEMRDPVSLVEHPRNYNTHPAEQIRLLAKIIKHQGWRNPITVSKRSGYVVKGHGRLAAAMLLKCEEVPIDLQDYKDEASELADMIADNRIAELAEADQDALKGLLLDETFNDFDIELTGYLEEEVSFSLNNDKEIIDDSDSLGDLSTKAQELQKKWNTKPGQIWALGSHKLLCGDSTVPENVKLLMGEDKAQAIHADPPYGMGKEKDGVQNDNLYSEKLDQFQMKWWSVFRPFLKNNASAYIWGNAEDLWRLWYKGGLKDSERITFRNEIVWQKPSGHGRGTEILRMFPTISERCLFFMIGEHGFHSNLDNYWEGFEPIRLYLENGIKKLGWTAKQISEWLNVSTGMPRHWISRSQWQLIKEDQYLELQQRAQKQVSGGSNPLSKSYDELKQNHDNQKKELNSTRAFFDNTHSLMSDVWSFDRVHGDERHEHATPKPVELVARCIKSSVEESQIVAEPFIGSGSTLVAAEQTNRKCYGMEINPDYVAVTLERWSNLTGKTPNLINNEN